jgi:hypothetical protein
MARAPSWYDHLDEAVGTLRHFPAPTVERPDVERVFHLSRRDAIRLLHKFGARERNDRLTIPRDALVRRLEAVRESPEYLSERRRREHLRESRAELHRHAAAQRILLPVAARAAEATVAMLPPYIRLYRGRMEVDFPEGCHDELLGRLLEVARAACDDPEGFRAAVEEAP